MKRNKFIILCLTGLIFLQSCAIKPSGGTGPGADKTLAETVTETAQVTPYPDMPASAAAYHQAADLIAGSDAYVAYIDEVLGFLTAMPDRYVGGRTNREAADYIADQMKQLGLEPFDGDDYLIPYRQNVDGKELLPDNVIGVLRGTEQMKTRAVVISCHFDTVHNTPGAVDNASGTAAMLCTARLLASIEADNRPDIIFCAFNGEEQFYIGSQAFVRTYGGTYELLYNINYDCVGMIEGGAYMMGAAEDDISFDLVGSVGAFLHDREILQNSCSNRDIRSDHVSFLEAGTPAICFSMNNILSVIHSPDDTVDRIDAGAIAELAASVTDFMEWEWNDSSERGRK